jgi:hypothetical protein
MYLDIEVVGALVDWLPSDAIDEAVAVLPRRVIEGLRQWASDVEAGKQLISIRPGNPLNDCEPVQVEPAIERAKKARAWLAFLARQDGARPSQ